VQVSSRFFTSPSQSQTKSVSSYNYEISKDFLSPNSDDFCELKSFDDTQIKGVTCFSDCIDESPPVYFSYPHFMDGDESLFEYLDGLKPDKNLHKSFMRIDPRTSTIVQSRLRMQTSLKLHYSKKYYKNFPEGLFFPTAWFDWAID
jgi:scavenger receptor class B protein 1